MNELYFHDKHIELRVGDALEEMRSLPDASVDCVVTSPPYWGLRDYGTAVWLGGDPGCLHTLGTTPHQRRTVKKRVPGLRSGAGKQCRNCGAIAHDRQYGLEPTIDEYVNRVRDVSAEVWRLLSAHGTFWINLRDTFSYHNSGTGRTGTATSVESARGVRHKSLMGIPWRVALSLQQDGWIIRNAIIWHKPNAIPDPASDRYSSRYEMVFFLVKQPEYHFDGDQALEPLSQSRPAHRKNHRGGTKPHTVKTPWRPTSNGKNLGDVWSISTRPLPEAHCAPFPIDLPHRCIAAGCPENGRVLDPFSGAGTTGLAARQLGRSFQGIDLRADYHDIFLQRLRQQGWRIEAANEGKPGVDVA
ncbi:DNA modification methylase [Saccharopolyspora antimicrobica]|uniref:Methyltransferase n=1 Tax=Saccharopolyspora antimicrobica TaxID=455193 RepID=A0A1I5B169_9PSEU|nr:site-specific DNA-methyltransferase [Saccharopolyspora antimicrobica]RKT86436.1 DNA modification methylase [Saccharopolyspora antimicrobica]SFN68463.1 DNA modification methylase [Saccharopolyspora antimicrobica]